MINSADEIEGFDVMDDHTQARIKKLIVAHKREGLPQHISRPKIRQVPGVGHEVPPGLECAGWCDLHER